MRVLMLGINYWPEETGIAPSNTGRCEYLAARGHDVTMCTAFPYYPRWRVHEGYRGRLVARETRNGVRILRTALYVPRRVTAARRILHEASFVASACLRALASRRPDVLVAVSPPLGLTLPALLLSRLWRVPYVLHVPDLQPDAAVELGMLPAGRLTQLLYAIERAAYRHAALISTLTVAMRRRIVAKGVPADRVRLLPDWVEPSLFEVPLEGGGAVTRAALGVGDRCLVVHVGNMGVKQGLEVIVDAAARARGRAAVEYVLVGDGAARPALEARLAAARLDNVQLLPLQPVAAFRDLLAAADIALVTQQRVVADIVFPSKVLTLLAAGRPVVGSLNAGSEVARVLTDSAAGVVVPPEDPEALADAVHALASDAARRRQLGAQGRAYARVHWNRERIMPALEGALLRVAAGGRGRGGRPARPAGAPDGSSETSRAG